MITTRTASLVAVLAMVSQTNAHIALWHKSMYGLNGTNGLNPFNTAEPAQPLENAKFSDWWFHGFMNQPPKAGDYFQIPAGGTAMVEIASNKAWTTLGVNQPTTQCPLGPNYCKDWNYQGDHLVWDTMHTTGHSNIKGCAIAMAYKSDPTQINPEDFTVVSVQKECVWKREVAFSFPKQLQACPPGGCHCLWSWIHSFEGGTAQTTHTFFRCQVTNPSVPGRPLGKAVPAVQCDQDPKKCVVGAKQPMYWKFAERNNQFQDAPNPPTYGTTFGFNDGPQNDAFALVALNPHRRDTWLPQGRRRSEQSIDSQDD